MGADGNPDVRLMELLLEGEHEMNERRLPLIPMERIVKDSIENLRHWYGVEATEPQVRELLETNSAVTAEPQSMGVDTVGREMLIDLLGKRIGMGDRHWPLNMDDEKYKDRYYRDFAIKAISAGWKLVPGFVGLPDLTDKQREVLQALPVDTKESTPRYCKGQDFVAASKLEGMCCARRVCNGVFVGAYFVRTPLGTATLGG